jgi:uncharacterized membrane protein YsdA (DUF1294 family)
MIVAFASSTFIQALLLIFAFWVVYLWQARATPARAKSLVLIALFLAGVALLVAVTAVVLRGLGQRTNGELILIPLAYLSTSIVTFFLYGYDKRASKEAKDSRIDERTLHLLEFLGGWPGALLGQRHFKHKTRWKEEFRFKLVTLLIALLHLTFWVLLSAGVIRF